MKTYYWDFFGPRAEGTASHFCHHLTEFFEKHGFAGCEIELTSEGDGHAAARCRAPLDAQEAIEHSLRPNRWDPC